eukprot:9928662-Alexandrium_andersonii.AAC.1
MAPKHLCEVVQTSIWGVSTAGRQPVFRFAPNCHDSSGVLVWRREVCDSHLAVATRTHENSRLRHICRQRPRQRQ